MQSTAELPRGDVAPIDLHDTTQTIASFHRTLMDRRSETPDWDAFDASQYSPANIENARRQWLSRAHAEYASTAQFAQLLHRLTVLGAPIEIIGAATRLAQDECRHAEYCARILPLLGHTDTVEVSGRKLALFASEPDPWIAVYRTVLTVCCFGEAISVPVLRALHIVSSDPLPKLICEIIAFDEEYHARWGWEMLQWLTPRLDDKQRDRVRGRLPLLMSHFESVCGGTPEILEQVAGEELSFEEEENNLGTLTRVQYAGLFYHALTESILPGLAELGFDGAAAWAARGSVDRQRAGGDETLELSTGRA